MDSGRIKTIAGVTYYKIKKKRKNSTIPIIKTYNEK